MVNVLDMCERAPNANWTVGAHAMTPFRERRDKHDIRHDVACIRAISTMRAAGRA